MTDVAPAPEGRAGKMRRPRVMPDVVRAMATDILGGRYQPGALLPRENDLGLQYGVSRTVIREALKVLAAKGLVLGRPRVGTIVCDPEVWNVIDPQLIEWHSPETMDHRLLDSILETRRAIEPLVAAFAAQRATMQEIADVEAAWRGMADSVADVDGFTRHDIDYHRIIYAASHNPIFRQIGNLIDPALRFALQASAENSVDDRRASIDAHYALVEALRLRDPAAARRATEEILGIATRDLTTAKELQTQSEPSAP